jgi:hypothetical protein
MPHKNTDLNVGGATELKYKFVRLIVNTEGSGDPCFEVFERGKTPSAPHQDEGVLGQHLHAKANVHEHDK